MDRAVEKFRYRYSLCWIVGTGSDPDIDYQISSQNPPGPPASFYNENLNAFDVENPLQAWPGVRGRADKPTRDQFFGEQLREYQTASALKDAIRELDIDLRQEPSYSRLLLDHLISQSGRRKGTINELILFLEDPHLNIPGAGNYIGVIEHYASRGARLSKQHAVFDAVTRALKLGIVPAEEINAIITSLSDLGRTKKSARANDEKLLTRLYRQMWDAIGECDIYGHQHLDERIVDAWLGVLLGNGTADDFLLAKDILLVTNHDVPTDSWLAKFLTRWLHDRRFSRLGFDGEHVIELLKPFHPDLVSSSILRVTEALFSSKKTDFLKRWESCLARLHDSSTIASSRVWTHIRVYHDGTSHLPPMSPRHRIIQRLWALYTMTKGALRSSGLNVSCPTIKSLYRLYDTTRGDDGIEDLWSSLTKDIHDLNIPFDLEAMADELRTGKSMSSATRFTLQKYESSPLSFSEIFADIHLFNAAGRVFFHNIEKMVREVDVASPTFRNYATRTARTGNTHDVWTLIRLLRSHTPLKIALSMSWHAPDPEDKSLTPNQINPRTASEPDPHAALELIHALAAAFACSEQLSPRRAFQLVHWLYVFLYRHGAPVRPPLARALYHAGVIRYRREKSHVSVGQFEYIWNIVEQAEGPEVVLALKARSFDDSA